MRTGTYYIRLRYVFITPCCGAFHITIKSHIDSNRRR